MGKRNRNIQLNRFYWHKNDNSISNNPGYHPCYVYGKKGKKYKVLCFTHKAKRGERRKLNYNINPKENCYVLNKAKLSKESDISYRIYGYRIPQNKRDKKILTKIKKKI